MEADSASCDVSSRHVHLLESAHRRQLRLLTRYCTEDFTLGIIVRIDHERTLGAMELSNFFLEVLKIRTFSVRKTRPALPSSELGLRASSSRNAVRRSPLVDKERKPLEEKLVAYCHIWVVARFCPALRVTRASSKLRSTSGEHEFWAYWCSGNATGHITDYIIESIVYGLLS